MIISLARMIYKYDLHIRGVIHIGAHWGEEYPDYKQFDVKYMAFFEPVKRNFDMLVDFLPEDDHIQVFNMALGNENGTKEMYLETTNHGQSCSLLEPGTHLKTYPHIKFDEKEIVQISRLDDVVLDFSLYNMINIDVQGYELEVFKGAIRTLAGIDIIYTEVNFDEVYKGCCRVEDIDDFLANYGFRRVLTEEKYRYTCGWGDALYLKEKL
jgi:FkbM family methyltransferase